MDEHKNLLIGGADGYVWEDIQYWVNSMKQACPTADIALVATNIELKEAERIKAKGVNVTLYGERDGDYFKPVQDFAPHVARFFYMWQVLNEMKNPYTNVISTDTRDVIFQRDPFELLEDRFGEFVVSSEGIRYQNEPWGAQNYIQCFGSILYEQNKDELIKNVGVFGGPLDFVRDMLLHIFTNSVNRSIPIVDQAVFNFILSNSMIRDTLYESFNDDGWAIQLGTTEMAVENGAGDLGKHVEQINDMSWYHSIYEDEQPSIDVGDASITNSQNQEFAIVHQYDRIEGLGEQIRAKYGDRENEMLRVKV